MKHLYIICILLLNVSFSFAHNKFIKGIVVDENDQPLIGANVVWLNTTIGASTDNEGRFDIDNILDDDNDMLVGSYIGLQSDTVEVMSCCQEVFIKLYSNTTLKEVVVKGQGMGTMNSRLEPLQTQKLGVAEFHRAACCNLSEAFETNASVDVSYSDAATGAKQIRLLGLSNVYVQMMTENNPNFRGVASLYGLDYIPGPWMESIQISKGAASVKNGYEAVTGQINVEYKKPNNSDPLTVNLFGSDNGRMEGNVDANVSLGKHVSTGLFMHYSNDKKNHDANDDGFLDRPRLEQINAMNRWTINKGAWHSELGFKFIKENRESGQTPHIHPEQDLYEVALNTERYEAFMKNGIVLNHHNNTSIALILSASRHNLKSNYGYNTYDLTQNNLYGSLLFETDIREKHQLSTGLSFVGDFIDQTMLIPGEKPLYNPKREEYVPGAYVQYTYKPTHNITLLAGLRGDHHNQYGYFVTPRFHAKYDPFEWLQLRGSVGKGYRSVNVLAENNNYLASSRVKNLYIAENLDMEDALNWGFSASAHIPVGDKEISLTADYYRTEFNKQVVMDMETDPNGIYCYNLNGKSYANSVQVEAGFPLFRGFEVRAAYRFNDAKVTYNGILKEKALQSRHKGLLTASYQTPNCEKRWQFDYTLQLNGGGRMPSPDSANPLWNERFKPYTVTHLQISKFFKNCSFYIGAENLFNFTQSNPIIDAANPFGNSFDATMIWGPVHGRSLYAGIRWNIPGHKSH